MSKLRLTAASQLIVLTKMGVGRGRRASTSLSTGLSFEFILLAGKILTVYSQKEIPNLCWTCNVKTLLVYH